MGIFKKKNVENKNNVTNIDNNNIANVNNDSTVEDIRERLNSVEPKILEKHIEKYGDSFLVEYYDKDKELFDKYVLVATNKGKNIPVSKYNENGVFFLNWSTHYIGGFQNNIIPMYELISKDTILGFMELMVDTHDEFVGRMIEMVKKWESDEESNNK